MVKQGTMHWLEFAQEDCKENSTSERRGLGIWSMELANIPPSCFVRRRRLPGEQWCVFFIGR